MRRIDQILLRLAGCVAPAVWALAAPACDVPVFRYALERWEADPYQVVVFCSKPLTTEQQAALSTLEKGGQGGAANLVVNRVNLAQEMPPLLRALWKAQEHPTPPWIVAKFPKQTGIELPAWTGALSPDSVGALVESPARREIIRNLMRGDAVVWLLLECGDKGRNDAAGALVEAELRNLEKSLVLPQQSPVDPPINPALPLKIAFSTVRVARSDPGERVLMNLLLNWSTNLISAQEPMLFPIFGRGRVIPPAIGDEIRAEAIREMAEFLTGPCSCEVKAMNPGYDLLLTANWTSLPAYREAAPSPPPLVGMSQFAAAAATDPAAPPRQPAVSLEAASTKPVPVGRDRLVRNLVFVLGIGVIFLAVTTLVLKVRTGRKPR